MMYDPYPARRSTFGQLGVSALHSLLLLAASLAIALANPPPSLPAAGPAGSDPYARALAQGREAEEKGDAATAARAFEQAVVLRPTSGAALSELSWAAFLAGDLERAEQAARRALAAPATSAHVQASALYNLGRISEAKKQPEAAISSYKESLKKRLTSAALSRLQVLDATAAAWFESLQAKQMSGPYASLRSLCASMGEDSDTCYQNLPWGKTTEPKTPLLPPYAAARLFYREDTSECSVGIQLPSGWYSAPFSCGWRSFHALAAEYEVSDLLPGGTPEFILRVYNETGYKADEFSEDENGNKIHLRPLVPLCQKLWIICGLGSKGAPSCIEMTLAEKDDRRGCPIDQSKIRWDWQLDPTFHAGGTAVFKARGTLPKGRLRPDAAGSHILIFPDWR